MSAELLKDRLPKKWAAKWIDPELPHEETARQSAAVLRRSFSVTQFGRAVLYITCHGLYEAVLNGKRVGDFVLAPGTGDYRKRLAVQAYDVSALLREGENELQATLGDGWYRGCVGIDGLRNYYGNDIALLCQLEADGVPILVSDETWEASSEGPVRENDLQQGETYDARKEEITDWHKVRVRDFDFTPLSGEPFVPIRTQERFSGALMTTPNGETVVDFGQNLTGWTEIRVSAKAGQRITLWHGEALDEADNFTQINFDPGERNKNGGIPQKTTYICKDGENVWHPRFSVFGFRYAKIETDIDLNDASFTAVAVYSELPQTGFFSCGNDKINRLFRNCLWSMRSNFCDVPTDCPTRERAGWTGDAEVFAPTAVFLADCLPVYRKWLGECRLAQRENGLVENIAPVNHNGGMISNLLQGSAGWGDACILVPWTLYEAYGDRTILEENYEMMKRWLAFCLKRAEKTRLKNRKNPDRRYLADQGFHFGEWCEPDVSNMETMKQTMMHGAPEVATAYLFRSASLLSKISEVLGKPEDAASYAEIAEKARRAYRFSCTDHGSIRSKRQAEYVRPIAFGLLNEEEMPAAADALDQLVRENGFHLNTGFLSTPMLCRVLADYGHADTAYRLLLQETCPSWLYAVNKGATTIWETWDGVREDGTVHDSLNHYAYGAIAGWFFDGIAGIRLSPEGLRIAPHPDPSLGFAKAAWDSPKGRIESAWRYEGDEVRYEFTVPAGLTAEVSLPDGRKYDVRVDAFNDTGITKGTTVRLS